MCAAYLTENTAPLLCLARGVDQFDVYSYCGDFSITCIEGTVGGLPSLLQRRRRKTDAGWDARTLIDFSGILVDRQRLERSFDKM